MPEVFSPEEAKILDDIKSRMGSIKTYQGWANDYQKKVEEIQVSLDSATKTRNNYLKDVEKYTSELAVLKGKLKDLLVPPAPIPVPATQVLTASVVEDCVDQLESRSKSETQNAVAF